MGRPLGGIEAVVMGASAGGIEALSEVLQALPATFRPALIIVQHLPRDRASMLLGIFSRRCVLPVVEAYDKLAITPGTVFLAPADYHLLVDVGPQLALSIEAPVHFSRPAIDVLFESAADVYGVKVMGVVLTGANADGADGLEAIRAGGGVTVVQDPETADYPVMPQAALSRGPADYVVALPALCELLGGMTTTSSTGPSPEGAS